MKKKFRVFLSSIALLSLTTTTFGLGDTPTINTNTPETTPTAPPVASTTGAITAVYGNGTPLIILADSDNSTTSIYKDINGNGIVDAGETAVTGALQKDLSNATIYGGSLNESVSQSLITMIGGTVGSIYGGGNAQDAPATINGPTVINISGGTIVNNINGGNAGTENTTVNTNPISLNVAGFPANENGFNTTIEPVFSTATSSEQNGAIKIGDSSTGIDLASFTTQTFNIVDTDNTSIPQTDTSGTSATSNPGTISLQTNAATNVTSTTTSPTETTSTGDGITATITPEATVTLTFSGSPTKIPTTAANTTSYVISTGTVTISGTGSGTLATVSASGTGRPTCKCKSLKFEW